MVKERVKPNTKICTQRIILWELVCVFCLDSLFFVGAIIDADNDLFLMAMLSFSFLIAGVGVICFIKTGIVWASLKTVCKGEYSYRNAKKNRLPVPLYCYGQMDGGIRAVRLSPVMGTVGKLRIAETEIDLLESM